MCSLGLCGCGKGRPVFAGVLDPYPVSGHSARGRQDGCNGCGQSGIALKDNKVTVSEAGPYLIVAAPQVGRADAGPLGCFDLWLRVNGSDVANSNVQLCQDAGSRAKDVIISQGIVPMAAGGVLEVMMSANNPGANMCIEAIQPPGEPLVPSIIFSMIK
jgi:hypothetical protein